MWEVYVQLPIIAALISANWCCDYSESVHDILGLPASNRRYLVSCHR